MEPAGFLVELDDLGLATRQSHELDDPFEELARRATRGACKHTRTHTHTHTQRCSSDAGDAKFEWRKLTEDHNLEPEGKGQTGAEDGDSVCGREGA